MKKVHIIEGKQFVDQRGKLNFANGFSFDDVKRFYIITHTDTKTVRAWQGHKEEKKYFFVVQGTFIIAWVKIDNWDKPSSDLKAEYIIVNENDSPVICIPAGFANGLKALETNSKVLVFSEFELKKSVDKKIRFDPKLWLDWESIKLK